MSLAQTSSSTNSRLARPAVARSRRRAATAVPAAASTDPAARPAGQQPAAGAAAPTAGSSGAHSATSTRPSRRPAADQQRVHASRRTRGRPARAAPAPRPRSPAGRRSRPATRRAGAGGLRRAGRQTAAPGAHTRPAPRRNGSAEIGPQHVEEHQLGIGRLPQQEVRQPLLAGGADDQVGVGDAGGRQEAGERRLVERRPGRARRPRAAAATARAAATISARAAIGQRHRQVEPRIARGRRARPAPGRAGCRRRSGSRSPMKRSRTPSRAKLGDLGPQVVAQQAGEVEHLAGRPAPVLAGEGVERQPAARRGGSPPRWCGAPRGRRRDGRRSAAGRARRPSGRCRP